jgi:hypothetical protein
MLRRCLLGLAVLGGLLAVPAPAARAGGWATVTLDILPPQVRAGDNLHLGFMVRQHGVTPIDTIDPRGPGLQPILSAARRETGESVRSVAQKEGPVGHFVVDVTFPSAGAWDWEIRPEPFEATKFETLKVTPAAGATTNLASPLAAGAPLEGPVDTAAATGSDGRRAVRTSLVVAGIGLLLAGLGVSLSRRDGALGRRLRAKAPRA